jgi:hypothetical protein
MPRLLQIASVARRRLRQRSGLNVIVLELDVPA